MKFDFFMCFGADTEIMYALLVCIHFSSKTHSAGYINNSAVVCIVYQAPKIRAIKGG